MSAEAREKKMCGSIVCFVFLLMIPPLHKSDACKKPDNSN